MLLRTASLGWAVRIAIVSCACGALVACGGGGGGGMVRSDAPPPAAPTTQPSPPVTPPVVFAPDPAFSDHLRLTGADAAHSAGYTGAGVRIGVLDGGVMHTHPALAPRVVANLTYVSSPPNNLAVDDVEGHGTAVSQIMAGIPFGRWPGGIAPGAEIVSARILNDTDPPDDGSGNGNNTGTSLGLASIHQALIARGVRVMNNSWGGVYWTDPAATNSIANEYRPFVISNGGLVVFASGNESKTDPSSIAALPSQAGPGGTRPAADLERGWLTVGALDPATMALASYSNQCGVAVRYCLVAPGTVATTGTNDTPTSPTYWRWSGTSLAAPQVSGAAALVWQAFPYFNNDLVRQTLLGTAQDLGAAGADPTYGYGLLNVGMAVRGPMKLDWGSVTVSFDSGTSTWLNPISGAGGLTKEGTGTLVLSSAISYSGHTQINAGTLRLTGSFAPAAPASIDIGPNGTLSGNTNVNANVTNAGTVAVDGNATLAIFGNYHQTSTGRLAVIVGDILFVNGTAQLDGGTLHVLGKKSLVTVPSRQAVLRADGGLTGQFVNLTAAPGIFLTATIGYSATEAWLDLTRLDVTATAQSMGFTAESVASAQRVEGSFDAIEQGGGSSDVLAGAGAIQGSPTAAAAEQTLSSLSGQLHGADTAFAMMAVENNRRALESRMDALDDTRSAGTWYDAQHAQRAVPGFDIDAEGWMMGQDLRFNERMTLGVAVAGTDGYAHHAQRYDRERNRQFEGQFYAAYDLGRGYLLGSVALGRMQRWTQRDVLLGVDSFRLQTDYADRYASAAMQLAWPVRAGSGRITPYAGVQTLRLLRSGFSEQGAAGFGLTTGDSAMTLSQSLLGARVAHDWQRSRARWSLDGRLEWQHLLDQSGGDIPARFTALDVWAPITGTAIDRDIGVFGLGLETFFGRGSRLRVDLDHRFNGDSNGSGAALTWTSAF